MARALGVSLPISTKESVEVCSFLRSKPLKRAQRELEEVMELRLPVPYRRFNHDTPHQHGAVAAGRYPAKTCEYIARVLASAKANARAKGLNEAALVIQSIAAHKGSNQYKGGRHRGRMMKNTHIEVVLAEVAATEKPKKKEAKK
jgi:large subunit ribosomal protein L22